MDADACVAHPSALDPTLSPRPRPTLVALNVPHSSFNVSRSPLNVPRSLTTTLARLATHSLSRRHLLDSPLTLSHCKECGGSSICEHNKQRHQCKACGGTSICEYNQTKARCTVCCGGPGARMWREKSESKVGHTLRWVTTMTRVGRRNKQLASSLAVEMEEQEQEEQGE
jgi:hypothetical protein